MRAKPDGLRVVADGCLPAEHWDPIQNTEAAFSMPKIGAALLCRVSR